MPQVLPWWCPHTDLMFPTKALYRAHLRRIAMPRYRKRCAEIRWNEEARRIDGSLVYAGSLDEVADWANENLGPLACALYDKNTTKDIRAGDRVVSATGSVMNFRFAEFKRVDKPPIPSHCLPDRLASAPGWSGMVRWKVDGPNCFLFEVEKVLDMCGIYCGGGSGQKLSDTSSASVLRIFMAAEDWPNFNMANHLTSSNLRVSVAA